MLLLGDGQVTDELWGGERGCGEREGSGDSWDGHGKITTSFSPPSNFHKLMGPPAHHPSHPNPTQHLLLLLLARHHFWCQRDLIKKVERLIIIQASSSFSSHHEKGTKKKLPILFHDKLFWVASPPGFLRKEIPQSHPQLPSVTTYITTTR